MNNGKNHAPVVRHVLKDMIGKVLLLAFGLWLWDVTTKPVEYIGLFLAGLACLGLLISSWWLYVAWTYRRRQKIWRYQAYVHTQGRTASLASSSDEVIHKIAGSKGAFLGAFMNMLLFYDFFASGNGHGVCLAPARTGKSSCNYIPTLMSEFSCSIFSNDTKKEGYDVTADIRRAHGQRVIKIDPFGSNSDDDFNPIYILADDVAFNKGREVHELADIVAQCLLPEPEGGSGDNKVFRDGGRRFLIALLLHMAALEPPTDCHLVRLRELVWSSNEGLKIVAVRLQQSQALNGLLKSYGNVLYNMLDKNFAKTFNCFRTEALEGVKIYDPSSPWTNHITKSTCTYEEMLDGNTSTYNCLPQDKLITHGKHNTLITTLLIEKVARHPERTRLLMLLDEAGNIPRIPKTTLKSAISLLPSKGLRLYSMWQSFSQMRDLYGEEMSNLIMDQASMVQAWSIRDLKQQEHWSKRIGTTTVKRASFNQDASEMDYSLSPRIDEKEEKILNEREIALMPDDEQLINISGHPIIRANRVPFWQVKEFRKWAKPNPCEPAGYPAHQPVKYSLAAN